MLFPGFSSSLAVGISTKNMSVWGSFCIFTTSILASLLGVEVNILHHLGNFQARLLCLSPAPGSSAGARCARGPGAALRPSPFPARPVPSRWPAGRPPCHSLPPRRRRVFRLLFIFFYLCLGQWSLLGAPSLPAAGPAGSRVPKAAPRLCLQVQPGSRLSPRPAQTGLLLRVSYSAVGIWTLQDVMERSG